MGNSELMKKKGYFTLFGEAYKFMGEAMVEEDWAVIVENADDLGRKYKGTELGTFAEQLIIAIAKELERAK